MQIATAGVGKQQARISQAAAGEEEAELDEPEPTFNWTKSKKLRGEWTEVEDAKGQKGFSFVVFAKSANVPTDPETSFWNSRDGLINPKSDFMTTW